jgi:hypothetical protein
MLGWTDGRAEGSLLYGLIRRQSGDAMGYAVRIIDCYLWSPEGIGAYFLPDWYITYRDAISAAEAHLRRLKRPAGTATFTILRRR